MTSPRKQSIAAAAIAAALIACLAAAPAAFAQAVAVDFILVANPDVLKPAGLDNFNDDIFDGWFVIEGAVESTDEFAGELHLDAPDYLVLPVTTDLSSDVFVVTLIDVSTLPAGLSVSLVVASATESRSVAYFGDVAYLLDESGVILGTSAPLDPAATTVQLLYVQPAGGDPFVQVDPGADGDPVTITNTANALDPISFVGFRLQDGDGDGFSPPEDCNDADATVNPSAADSNCDGVDNNCSGTADDGYVSDETCFLPGACEADNVGSSCTAGAENLCATGTPADDANCNGVDDDCDGVIDNGANTLETIGGAIFSYCEERLWWGRDGVEVTVSGPNGDFTAITAGPSGTWHIEDVPCGEYSVTPNHAMREYCHVDFGGICPPEPCETSLTINVDADHRADNLSIQFFERLTCIPNDLNYDGVCTIVFDTELFMQCVYEHDCVGPDGRDLLCPSDCNCDGLATIIFDANCFRDTVYGNGVCGECPASAAVSSGGEIRPVASGFTIGGAVYDDETDPLLSGIEGVNVHVLGAGRKAVASAATAGPSGIWRVDDLPAGTYAVVFDRPNGGAAARRDVIPITVNIENKAANLSIRLLRSPELSRRNTNRAK